MKYPGSLLILLFIFAVHRAGGQNLHPSKDNLACLWGMKNDSGKWVVAAKYTVLERSYDHLYRAMLNEKWGLLDPSGKELIPPLYDKLDPVDPGYDGRPDDYTVSEVVAVKDGKSGLIDLSGKTLVPFQYDAIWRSPYESWLHVVLDKKTGLRTYEKELLPCRYPYLEKIANSSLFIVASSDLRWNSGDVFGAPNLGVINLNGDTVIPCRFDALTLPNQPSYSRNTVPRIRSAYPKSLLITARHGDSISLYTFEGKCLLEPQYKIMAASQFDVDRQVYFFSYPSPGNESFYEGDPLVFSVSGKLGFVTPGEGLVQPAVFDSVYMHLHRLKRPGLYRVKKNDKWGLLDADGHALLPCTFTQIQICQEQIFVSQKKEKFQEYDWRSKKIKPKVYQKILPAGNSYVDLISGNKFYSNYDDTVIYPCTVMGYLPEDIVIIRPGNAIEGRGPDAKRIDMNYVRYSSSRHFSVRSKKGSLLCDGNFRVIVPPGVYQSFHNMQNSKDIVVISMGGKVGMIDTAGRTVIDTVFEAMGTSRVNGMLFVKPPPRNKSDERGCADGWAIADTTGKLLTRPIIRATELSEYQARQFLMTSEGVGIFDIYERRFMTPTHFLNGFFTGDGGCIMQTQDSLFLPYSFEGKQMSAKAWKGLLHVAGNRETRYYSSDYDIVNGHIIRDSTQLDDTWLLVNGDSLVILNRDELIRDRQTVLTLLYDYFRTADDRDLPRDNRWAYYSQYEPVASDCPRLETGEEAPAPYNFFFTGVVGDTLPVAEKVSQKKQNNDSLVLHVVHRSLGKVEYPLYPNHAFSCDCFASDYEHSLVEARRDPRQLRAYPFSVYYRVVHRNADVISLQVLDQYNYSNYTSSEERTFSRQSVFENYAIAKDRWHPLQLSHLFKPGYEKVLNAEIITAVQKADSLELDCRNPATYLQQCEGRFSFSDKGLLLYMEDHSGYEFAALLVPWNRIRTIIPPQSPAFPFLKK